jgi:methionine-rich copper-binding protein CopC
MRLRISIRTPFEDRDMTFRHMLVASILASAIVAAPAIAHPKLLSSSPANKAVVASPSQIRLSFSESLLAPLSGIDLAMTAMPGMANHGVMKVAGFQTSLAPDGKTLVAALPRALRAGNYTVKWHAVSTDTHRVEGSFSFTVK